MNLFKVTPKFFIYFIIITLGPAMQLAKFFEYLLEQISFIDTIRQFIDLGIIEAPTTVIIIHLLFCLYESYLWKICPFRYIHQIPDINGRYEGEIESSLDNNKYKIALEIKQTLSNVLVSLYSEKSSSASFISNIAKNNHDNWVLSYIYRNNPKTVAGDLDMRIHDGFASLEIFDNGQKLSGTYFNDSRERKTHGLLTCSFIDKKTKGHF